MARQVGIRKAEAISASEAMEATPNSWRHIEALVEIPPEFNDDNAASVGVIYLTAFAAIVRTGEVKKLISESKSRK